MYAMHYLCNNVAIVILARESTRSCNYVGHQKALNSAKILEHPQKYNSKEDEEREVFFFPLDEEGERYQTK